MFSYGTIIRIAFIGLVLVGCVQTRPLDQGYWPCETPEDCPSSAFACHFAFCVNGGCVYQDLAGFCDQDTGSQPTPDEGTDVADEGTDVADEGTDVADEGHIPPDIPAVDLCADVVCDGSGDDLCHYTACDPDQGICVPVIQNNGLFCDDGDPCTVTECHAGTCQIVSGCNDDNPCTEDSCHEVLGCQYEPIDGCS